MLSQHRNLPVFLSLGLWSNALAPSFPVKAGPRSLGPSLPDPLPTFGSGREDNASDLGSSPAFSSAPALPPVRWSTGFLLNAVCQQARDKSRLCRGTTSVWKYSPSSSRKNVLGRVSHGSPLKSGEVAKNRIRSNEGASSLISLLRFRSSSFISSVNLAHSSSQTPKIAWGGQA